MAKKFVIDLLVNADGSVKSVNGVKGAITSLKDTADKATGGMISKFSNFGKSILGVTKGLGGTTKALQVFKVALVSTGVGAIVVAFGSLVTFLTSTQRGMDKVSKATAALGAAFDVIKDRISTVGEAFSLLFSGKPGEAFDKLKESVSGLTEEIVEETKQAYNLKDALLDLRDTEISLIASTAKRRKEIAQARLDAEDETKTTQERIAALDKAAQLETDILNEQLQIAKERARITAEQVGLGESLTEDIRAREEAEARVFELEERSLLLQKSLSTRRNALIRQDEAERKRILEERKVEALDISGLKTKEGEDDTTLNEKIIANQKKRLEEQEKDIQKEIELDQQRKANKRMVLDAIGQFANAETGIGRALLIAKQAMMFQETIMDLKRITFKGTQAIGEAGVNSAQNISESSKIGFPQNLITIAGAIAQGVSIIGSVKKAVSRTKAASTAGAVSTPRIATPSAPQQAPAFNIVGAGATNQLAETIAGQPPVKAFVVSQDVTSAQSLERNIVEGASI